MSTRVPRSALIVVVALCFAAAAAAFDGGSRPTQVTELATATAVADATDTPAIEAPPSSEATPTETPTEVPPTATAPPTAIPATSTPTRTPTRVPTHTAVRAPTSPTLQPTATRTNAVSAQIAPVAAGAAVSLNADEQEMFSLVNQARVAAGLTSLTIDPTFESVARARAIGMARTAYYSHYDPATGQLAARSMLQRLGVGVPMGENFYVNWPYTGAFAQRAMQWFMNDPPHHDNILSPRWTVAGIGVISTSDQKGVAIQVFGMK